MSWDPNCMLLPVYFSASGVLTEFHKGSTLTRPVRPCNTKRKRLGQGRKQRKVKFRTSGIACVSLYSKFKS